jgi:hypothetical protein
VSDPERNVHVPPGVRAGIWADDVEIFDDLYEATLDFIRVEPRDPRVGVVVARVTLPLYCILKLKRDLEGFQ